jgi:hypothetical protein
VCIGMRPTKSGTDAEIDDVRLYNHVLRPVDIKELYALDQLPHSGYTVRKITATASSSIIGHGPENTINGSGLTADGKHSTAGEDTWLGNLEPSGTWIQFEFDRVQTLIEMIVWNHNTSLEFILGLGIREAFVEVSVDGLLWTPMGTFEFRQATGLPAGPGTSLALGGIAARFVRITVFSNWGNILPQSGFGEVRFRAEADTF